MPDLATITLPLLVAIGVVNVVSMWKPNMDSRVKWGLSAAAALAVTFIPAEIGNVLLDHIKTALEVAFAASGTYKLAQKVGGQ